jgi:hypothetical protein
MSDSEAVETQDRTGRSPYCSLSTTYSTYFCPYKKHMAFYMQNYCWKEFL